MRTLVSWRPGLDDGARERLAEAHQRFAASNRTGTHGSRSADTSPGGCPGVLMPCSMSSPPAKPLRRPCSTASAILPPASGTGPCRWICGSGTSRGSGWRSTPGLPWWRPWPAESLRIIPPTPVLTAEESMSDPETRSEAPASLFEDLPAVDEAEVCAARRAERRQDALRLREPNRRQMELRATDLESLLGEDHRARLVWGYVERQDLSRVLEAIKARDHNVGRRRSTRAFCSRCGCTRRSRAWAAGGRSRGGCASMMRSAGSAAACR